MKINVWSLNIWHRHGDSIEIFGNEETAKAALDEYARDQWTDRFDDLPPADFEQAVQEYFDRRDDESAFLQPHEIEIGFDDLLRAKFRSMFLGAAKLFHIDVEKQSKSITS